MSSLNINQNNKPTGSTSGSRYTSKPYLGKPCPPPLAPGMDGSLDLELTCKYCKDTGHIKENCIKVNWLLALEKWETEKKVSSSSIIAMADQPKSNAVKLNSPSAMDQAVGAKKNGPDINYEELIQSIHNTSILVQTKWEIVLCAVAKCPRVSVSAHGIQIPSLLDLGSEVTLLRQSYFEQHLLLKLNWWHVKRSMHTHYLMSQSPMMDSHQSICTLTLRSPF